MCLSSLLPLFPILWFFLKPDSPIVSTAKQEQLGGTLTWLPPPARNSVGGYTNATVTMMMMMMMMMMIIIIIIITIMMMMMIPCQDELKSNFLFNPPGNKFTYPHLPKLAVFGPENLITW